MYLSTSNGLHHREKNAALFITAPQLSILDLFQEQVHHMVSSLDTLYQTMPQVASNASSLSQTRRV